MNSLTVFSDCTAASLTDFTSSRGHRTCKGIGFASGGFLFKVPPESAECLTNGMLTNIRADWRMGLSITLEYGNPRKLDMLVTIKGENLTELYRALKAWKVEWIAEFNAVDYDPPTDDGAPVIKSITILTTRPEEPPPVEKRH